MTDPILFRSTNGGAGGYSLGRALLTGQAPDRGLFMPERFPPLTRAQLVGMVGKSYPQVAFAVLRPYAADQFDDETLRAMCDDAYDYEVPIERVERRRHLLRLDMGPTASFKDFAARMMGRMIGRLVRPGDSPLVVLTATSGDTGSAVAQAFAGVPGIEVMVLFPIAEVSDRQRKQMTTIGGNVCTLAVEGKFDDCQAMAKRAFSDPRLAEVRLTSANSINIGRLLPQSVYYVYAYLRLADVAAGEPVVFSVPSGNFGDLCGGLLALRAGLPVRRFVVATNANDEVPRFFATGRYEKIVPSRVCLSNAMNVGHPSNLARVVDLYGGHMDEAGTLHRPPDMTRLRHDMWAVSIDDEETRSTIAAAWREKRVLLEPHGAVGWAALGRFCASGEVEPDALAVSLETAHPAKFPEQIRDLTGVDPALPPALAALEAKAESYERIGVDYEPLREIIAARYGRGR
ncbi:MAG: threonine synthase [Deltaproteobacteria bacterium]|nr:threonine synthase [Deltaproteobacteria bacterium]